MDEKDIQNLRRQYSKSTLSTASVSKDPFKQFDKWFQEVLNSGFLEPNAMTLATASKSGKPSARVVLLKGIHDNSFVFFGLIDDTHPFYKCRGVCRMVRGIV